MNEKVLTLFVNEELLFWKTESEILHKRKKK